MEIYVENFEYTFDMNFLLMICDFQGEFKRRVPIIR